MAISAIETHYRGHRFRSRLEARWAVFLDRAGIGWEYEPEGLRVTYRGNRTNWLPDFWLGSGQWAEVKGALSLEEAARLVLIALGATACPAGDLVVLGRIPPDESARWPAQLHHHRGDLFAFPWSLAPGCPLETSRPRVRLDPRATPDLSLLLDGILAGQPDWAEPALTYARQARFEHGQSG